MTHPKITASAIFFSILLTVSKSPAQQRIEISPDGRDTVVFDHLNTGGSFKADSIPFTVSPNWNLNLRMEVGGIDIGDLNNDGNVDLAVGCYHSQSFPPYPDWRNFVLYNLGTEFQSSPGWWTKDSTSTTEVRIADFNNDNHPDIYSGNGDGSFPPDGIYFGTAGDTLSHIAGWHAANSTWTTGVAVCDFDNDGDIDVATSNQGVSPNPYRPVSIFVNINGTLEQHPSWTSSASEISSGIQWGDMNNDGYKELAVSKWVNFHSCIYYNNHGTMEQIPRWTANTTQGQKGIAWGNLNDDSLMDIAIGGSIPTQAYINIDTTFGSTPAWQSHNAFHGTQDIAWGDINEDGYDDLATAEFSTGQFRIYMNRGGVLDSIPSWQYDSPNAGTALAFGDVNGDGHIDFITGVSGQPCISVFYNTISTGVAEHIHPGNFHLSQNYPNPFNPTTAIGFSLLAVSNVSLKVYDGLGREVATLINNATMEEGGHEASFDASTLSSGVYFYRITAKGENGQVLSQAKKLVLVR